MTPSSLQADQPEGSRGQPPSSPPHWMRTLATWLAAALVPLALAAGFNVGVDAQGYFGLNRYGSYGGDELLIKSSMVHHVEHDALLLGDSRAAFIDVSAVKGYRFFNAGVGGAGPQEYRALLEASDREALRLVILLESPNLSVCDESDDEEEMEGRQGVEALVHHALSFDALRRSAEYLLLRWRGYQPDHRPDGTRFEDNRLHIPFDWNGERDDRYLAKIAEYAEDGAIENSVGISESCKRLLNGMHDLVAEAGGEFLYVLSPVNHDIVARTGTDVEALRERVREQILEPLPYARDYTISEYGRGYNYSPYDAIHFLPESGALLLESAIGRKG